MVRAVVVLVGVLVPLACSLPSGPKGCGSLGSGDWHVCGANDTASLNEAPPSCQRVISSKQCDHVGAWKRWLATVPAASAQCVRPNTQCAFAAVPVSGAVSTNQTRIAYVVLVHTDVDEVDRLLRAIHHPAHHYLVHVDANNKPMLPHVRKLAVVASNANVQVVQWEAVAWGGASIVNILSRAMRHFAPLPWDYFVNLSGGDYPLLSQEGIGAFLATHGIPTAQNFIHLERQPLPDTLELCARMGAGTSWCSSGLASQLLVDVPCLQTDENTGHHQTPLRYGAAVVECDQRVYAVDAVVPPPFSNFVPYKGEFWVALHHSFVASVVNGTDSQLASTLISYFQQLFIPDESFTQTLVMASSHCGHVCDHSLHHVHWPQDYASPHPTTPPLEDLDALMRPGLAPADVRLFARKTDARTRDHIDKALAAQRTGKA